MGSLFLDCGLYFFFGVALCFSVWCAFAIVWMVVGTIKDKIKQRKDKKAAYRREIQDGCKSLWVQVFEEKRAEKGEMWACEHLESYGLIER